jgi:hypothetical protein
VLALLLAWPTVYVGWFGDDVWHRFAHLDTPKAEETLPKEMRMSGLMSMYSFWDRNPERNRRLIDLGIFPWWFDEETNACLWRPLTAAFSLMDYRLWPNTSELLHVHSLVWYAALVILASLFYRKIMGMGWAAGLAALLFAVFHINAIPISFLANRHTILGAFFGVLVLWMHDHWRKRNQVKWHILALTALLLSLLSSESGVVTFAYLLSYSLFIDSGSIKTRVVTLIPTLILILIWRFIYVSLGYGISGLELYVDPANGFFQFLYAVVTRTPILLLGVLAVPPPDIYILLSPAAIHIYALFAFVCLIMIGWLVYPYWKHCQIAKYWLFSALLSVIPLCAAFPSARNMMFSAFGAAGFIAQIVYNAKNTESPFAYSIRRRKYARTVICIFVFLHLLCGPIVLNQHAKLLKYIQYGMDRLCSIDLPDAEIEQHDLILVNLPVPPCFLIPYRLINHQSVPDRILTPTYSLDPVAYERFDEKTMVVRPQNGFAQPHVPVPEEKNPIYAHISIHHALNYVERLGWNQKEIRSGEMKVRLSGVTIAITELTSDNRPAAATFLFDVSLDDSKLTWLQWNKRDWRYEKFTPPPIGQSVTLY